MSKILIVEDDKNVLKALVIRLHARGYEVVTAQDAVMALAAVRDERPDLVLLDISLPAGNGFEVASRIRDEPAVANTPLIFITASRRPGLRERAEGLGAAAFFEKPYEAQQLLDSVEATLGTPSGC